MLHYTYTASGSKISQHYPFGLAIPSQSFALPNENDTYQNRYLYNGKEYQDDFGLNWYDYGARFYDPQIGRWHSVDPLAEWAYNLTPYRYGFNNPISFIDPDGMFESREEAKEWAKNKGIKTGWLFRRHKIQRNNDGTYAINNRKEGISYFRDDTFQADENSTTIGLGSDGVIKSVLFSASGKTNNKTSQFQRGGKIFTTRSGPSARSPNPIYATEDVSSINIDYFQVSVGSSRFKQSELDLAKAFKNSSELWKMKTNREIKLEGTNDRTDIKGQPIDDNGRPLIDTFSGRGWRTNWDGYFLKEGDSMWYEQEMGDGEIYKTQKKSIY